MPEALMLEDGKRSPHAAPEEEWRGWRDEQQRRMQMKGRGMGRWEVGGWVGREGGR